MFRLNEFSHQAPHHRSAIMVIQFKFVLQDSLKRRKNLFPFSTEAKLNVWLIPSCARLLQVGLIGNCARDINVIPIFIIRTIIVV
jgi:hypothetical protein